MTEDNEEKTGRDDDAGTMKPYRLTCINPPGNVAARRTEMRSARAAVQKEEQPGTLPPGPEPPLREREPVSAGAAGDSGTGDGALSMQKRMSPGIRGHPPYVAIGEALRKAKAQGHLIFALEPAGELPVHFVTVDGPCISLVRVRRLKYPGYGIAEIEHSCKNDIAALRSMTVPAEIFRELRVRGPDRHWYRYLVLPDYLMVIEEGDEQEDNGPGGEQDHKNQADGGAVPLPGNTGQRQDEDKQEDNGPEEDARPGGGEASRRGG